MSFLELNGRPISVASFEESQREVGSRAYGLDGTPLVDRLALKRVWKVETTPLMRGEASAVRAIVLGQGHTWPFDSDDYSDKGLPAESGAVRTLRSGTAGDGDPVHLESKFVGSVAVEGATTNLLGADSRDAENAPTGYSEIGSLVVLSANTTHYWQGSQSVEIDLPGDGTFSGLYTTPIDPGAGSAGKTYVGSVYLKQEYLVGAARVRLYDVTNDIAGFRNSYPGGSPPGAGWYRIDCSITIGGTDCRSLRLEVDGQDYPAGRSIFCDGFQIEEKEVPTSWVDGSRSSGVLAYPTSILGGFLEITFNAWARMRDSDSTDTRYLFFVSSDSNANRFVLYRSASTDNIAFTTTDSAAGNWDTLTETGLWNDEAWHMITAVLRLDPLSTEYIKELYVDGSLVDYSNPSGVPILFSAGYLEIGSALGGEQFDSGLIDDVLLVPYAASATQIANWYALGRAQPALPRVLVHGDAIRETDLSVEAIGRITGIPVVQAVADGSWQVSIEQVSFELEER